MPSEVEVPTLNHWTAGEVQVTLHILVCVCPSKHLIYASLVIIRLFLISADLFLFCK